jgi:hypothetical protein
MVVVAAATATTAESPAQLEGERKGSILGANGAKRLETYLKANT